MMAHRAVVALGANIGDRENALREASSALALWGAVEAVSPFYETAYEGSHGPQAPYLNAAVVMATDLTVWGLFASLVAIENSFGRKDKGGETPRVIDLDLIFFDEMIADFGALIVPHPRMHLRRFVLDPICDIAPDWEHPVLRKSVRVLVQR